MRRCYNWQNNQPGKRGKGQNTSQAIGKDVSDTFRPHPVIIPGQGGSKNWCFSGTKAAKMTGCRIRRQNPPTINLERGKWTETLPIHWKICVKVLCPFKWVLRGSRRLRSPGGLGAQKDPPGPGVAPGWGIKVSDRSLPIAWGVFWPFFLFPGWFFVNYGTLSFWLFLDPKAPIFGPAWTWNDTWMGHKSVQHTFSHCLGCVLAHFPVSRWITGLIWQPTAVVHFDPKNWCF